MRSQMSKFHTVGIRVREAINAKIRWFCVLMGSLYTTLIATMPTYCKINNNINMDTLFANMAEIIIKIAFYVGALIAIGGIFSLIVAYKDDNADGQTRAVRLIVVGVVLIGFRTILDIAGIIG